VLINGNLTSRFSGISELYRYVAPLRIRTCKLLLDRIPDTATARYPVRDGDTCFYIDRCDEKRIVPKVDQSYGMRKSPLCARNAIKVRQKYNMAENYLKRRWERQEEPEVHYPQAVDNCALNWRAAEYSKRSAVLNNEGRGCTRLRLSVRPSVPRSYEFAYCSRRAGAASSKARHMQDTSLFAEAFTPAVWSIQPPAHWVSGTPYLGDNAARASSWPITVI